MVYFGGYLEDFADWSNSTLLWTVV